MSSSAVLEEIIPLTSAAAASESSSFLEEAFGFENVENITYRYLVPLVCLPGIVAAALSTLIFARMRTTSLEVLLCGLSFFDVLVLTCSLFIYPSMKACTSIDEEHMIDSWVCHFFWKVTYISFPISLMAQVGSVWTYVAVTFDRFIAICYPIKQRVWCTPSTSSFILAIIGVFSIAFKFSTYFDTTLDEFGRIAPTELRQSYFYMMFYNFYLYVIIVQFIPWTIIIVLNFIVTHKVHLAYRLQAALTQCNNLGGKNKPKSRREEAERRITVMTLVITVIFILCNIPPGINNMLDTLDNEWKHRFRQRIVITNLLVCVNSATNTIVFAIFNRKFRRAVLKFLHITKAPHRSSSRYNREDASHFVRSRVATSENLLLTAASPTATKAVSSPLL